MNIVKTKQLKNTQFYPKADKKTMIFWHHTAGTTATGAIDWWNQTPEHVGTAFVIDRDGTIYQTFDPNNWAYHAGVKGDDDHIEKQSIGIEIVSAGNLQLEAGKFMFYPLFPNKIAGKEIPKDEVWDMDIKGWRGKRYYHSYTDKQIQSLIELTNKLMADFNIPLPPTWEESEFWEFDEKVIKSIVPGIHSHSTVRMDKNDIVPYESFINRVFKGIGKDNTKPKSESKKNK
jgi:N-acetyl-anhydromuramyl-L-alanine amidase AmpD